MTYGKLATSVWLMFDLLGIWDQSADGGRVDDQFGLIELRCIGLGQWTTVVAAEANLLLQEFLELVLVDEHMAQQVLDWLKIIYD